MRNPGIEDFFLISIEILEGIHIEEILPKIGNPGIEDFSLISM